MPISPHADNYTLGRGVVYFDKKITATHYEGERDLGNATTFAVALAIEKLEHFTSRSGLKAKDKTVITQITPTMTFTLDEVNVENVALTFMAETTAVTQAAADNLSAVLAYGYTGNRYYDLGDYRSVGVWKLQYDGGTGIFARDEVLTGGTGSQTWIVLQVDGDVTSGTLYLGTKTGATDIVDDEVITGSVAGAAVANGVVTFDATDLCVSDSAANTTFFDKTTDFTVDSTVGRIYIVAGGAIETAAASIDVDFACSAASYTKIEPFDDEQVEGRIRFVPDNPVGNNMELLFWRVDLAPGGEVGFIADDWQTMEFTGEILKDETYHSSAPYGEILTSDTVT